MVDTASALGLAQQQARARQRMKSANLRAGQPPPQQLSRLALTGWFVEAANDVGPHASPAACGEHFMVVDSADPKVGRWVGSHERVLQSEVQYM